MGPLTPNSLGELKETISFESNQLVINLLEKKEFDAVNDFASYLPVTVVSTLVGLPEDIRTKMVKWAPATFDVLGPLNRRILPLLPGMIFEFLSTYDLATR